MAHGDKNNKFEKAAAARTANVETILRSVANIKIVVAGPGTGKTFLFKQILGQKKKRALTLTFINSLVEDLSLELCGMSEVKTLHGFARGIIGNTGRNVHVYPALPAIIRNDLNILTGEDIDFDQIFHRRDDENKHIEFYKKRKDYYGHYGFTDLVYAAVRYLEQNKEKIPKYDQVLVDEFQDFNRLEVSLIDLLAAVNPILLVGDDDQALYFFKEASPQYIRDRHSNTSPGYEPHTITYCSRCTRVIVDACNDVITAAEKRDFLRGRIRKEFKYFEDKDREAECDEHPKLVHVRCYPTQIAYFIESELASIAEKVQKKFSVLIIAPTKTQCRQIVKALGGKGINVAYVDNNRGNEPSLLDGLRMIASDAESNLGWRIICRCLMTDDELKTLLTATAKNNRPINMELPAEFVKETRRLVSTLKKILKAQTVQTSEYDNLFGRLNLHPYEMSADFIRDTVDPELLTFGNPALKKIPIKVSTIPGSKGLAEDYVFIVHFDDRFFLEKDNQVSDHKICNFIVALTRARKRVYLLSCDSGVPTFLQWIQPDRVEIIPGNHVQK